MTCARYRSHALWLDTYMTYDCSTIRAIGDCAKMRMRRRPQNRVGDERVTFAEEVGRVLRHARDAHGLTLRRASDISGGLFRPTSLASYERGERAISLERFCRLSSVYGIPPERLLAETMRRVEGRPPLVFDRTSLERLEVAEAQIVDGFVREITMLRAEEEPSSTISLRAGDLEVLASASGRRREELFEAIRPALSDTR